MSKPRVALFVTCLVDLYRPAVGFSAIKLLEDAGCEVVVPLSQTCCGQPAFNSGDRASTQEIARQVIAAFLPYDYVVAPSGSCAGMISHHYPSLFAETDPEARAQAEALAAKTHELVSFLTDVLKVTRVEATYDGTITYHDSCSGLRELGVKAQPRRLLETVQGLAIKEQLLHLQIHPPQRQRARLPASEGVGGQLQGALHQRVVAEKLDGQVGAGHQIGSRTIVGTSHDGHREPKAQGQGEANAPWP
jgi:hypothetical protein